MAKIKKILVGVGDEKTLNSCLDAAIPIASANDATLTAVYVMPPMARSFMQTLHSPRKNPTKEAERVLSKVQKQCNENGVGFQKKILKGVARDKIVDLAKSGFDLVVIGRAHWGSRLLGSVSSAVVQHAKTNVLLVK